MKKFWKIVYHYYGEDTYKTEYIPKNIKRKSWWLNFDYQITIDQVSVVKM